MHAKKTHIRHFFNRFLLARILVSIDLSRISSIVKFVLFVSEYIRFSRIHMIY